MQVIGSYYSKSLCSIKKLQVKLGFGNQWNPFITKLSKKHPFFSVDYFDWPRAWMSAFSSTSTFCPSFAGITAILAIARASVVTGIDIYVGKKWATTPRTFLAIHSPGRDSWRSHSSTLGKTGRKGTFFSVICYLAFVVLNKAATRR